MQQNIIVLNSLMVDEQKKPIQEAAILLDALMVHPDLQEKLIEGMVGIFGKKEFKIMTTTEYKEYLNATYSDAAKALKNFQKKMVEAQQQNVSNSKTGN